ncbi:MAG: hypothetical protein K2X44_10880 [Magnetospirillum sp.]|nr:hypothetical protein [Magnetospirillum sp.]
MVTRLLLLALLLTQLAPLRMASAEAALPWGPGDICFSHEGGDAAPDTGGTASNECCSLACCQASLALSLIILLPLPVQYQAVAPAFPAVDDGLAAIAVQSSHRPRAPPVSIISA